MNYLEKLNEEDIRYICDVIPSDDVKKYLRKNPKEFAKIKPGFRPTSIKDDQTADILFAFRNKHFIGSFIEKHISNWVISIQNTIEKYVSEGESLYKAYIHTFPDCYFDKNIKLYFKLVEEKISDETIESISETIQVMRERESHIIKARKEDSNKKKEQQLNELVTSKDSIIRKLKAELRSQEKEQNKLLSTIASQSEELLKTEETLKNTQKKLEKIESTNKTLNDSIKRHEKLNKDISERNERLEQYAKEVEDASQKIEKQYTEIKRVLDETNYTIKGNNTVRRPCDMDQFKEFLSYNFDDIGLDTTKTEYRMLIEYVSRGDF